MCRWCCITCCAISWGAPPWQTWSRPDASTPPNTSAALTTQRGLVRDFWDGHIRKIKAWYHPVKDDVIVTASLNLIMDEVCRRLGVQHCICSVVDRQTLTVEYINFSANKVSAFRKCFGASAVPDAFYTDNAADLPMIHLSRTAYKVRHNRITRIK